jgi:hypothetical protein
MVKPKPTYLKVSDLVREHGVSRQRIHALIQAYGVKTKRGVENILFISPAEAAKIPPTKERRKGRPNVSTKK